MQNGKTRIYKTFLILLALLVTRFNCYAGVPYFFWMKSYSIEDYEEYAGHDLKVSHDDADALRNQFMASISARYPSVLVLDAGAVQDSDVTSDRLKGISEADMHEFVYYDGHGDNGTFFNRTGPIFLTGDNPAIDAGFSLGHYYTKWAIFSTCKSLELYKPPSFNPSMTNIQSHRIFQGIHSILGHKSVSWSGSETITTGWWFWKKTIHYKSAYINTEFVKNWVERGQTISDAWFNAIRKEYWEKGNEYFTGTKGVEPLVAGVWGYDLADNKVFDGPYEKFAEVIDRQLPSYDTYDWIYYGITTVSRKFGTPVYE